MRILQIARTAKHWHVDNPVLGTLALYKGFRFHGAEVLRAHERMDREFLKIWAKNVDFVFTTKLKDPSHFYFRLGKPTVCFLGDYRPDYHPINKFHDRFDILFKQYEEPGKEKFFIPTPVWSNPWKPGLSNERTGDWLWTGAISQHPYFEGYVRRKDIRVLPPESTTYFGLNGDRIHGWDYINQVQQHKFGLSCSHVHDVPRYTSSRLAHYLIGGLTPAVRWFPGVETLVPPGVFVYKTRQELKEFVKNPERQDPYYLHEFARETFDGKIAAKKILEVVECSGLL